MGTRLSETLGAPHADWAEWRTPFNERKAYQQGASPAESEPSA